MILLDTYTLNGVVSEPSRLSDAARQLIEDGGNELHVSAISAWEIAMAVQKKRLTLSMEPRSWFEGALVAKGLRCVDVSWQIALLSSELPMHHADPADRIILATAVLHNLILLTPDQDIHRYTQARVIW